MSRRIVGSVLLGVLLLVGIVWWFGRVQNPITSDSVTKVMAPSTVVTIQDLNEKVAALEKSNGEIKSSLEEAIGGINLLREELKECCQCKKKPSAKKVVKPKVKKATPAPAPAPRYVPPVYNKPTVPNPETGKAVPTMPLGIQPKLDCVNQQTKGVAPCAK